MRAGAKDLLAMTGEEWGDEITRALTGPRTPQRVLSGKCPHGDAPDRCAKCRGWLDLLEPQKGERDGEDN